MGSPSQKILFQERKGSPLEKFFFNERLPTGRLRIINQPDGPMTENIHDLKSTSAVGHVQTNLESSHPSPGGTGNAFLWMPNTNNLLVASLDQNPHPQQQQQSTFDVENSLWYNQFNYNEEPAPPGPSWNTPAATCR